MVDSLLFHLPFKSELVRFFGSVVCVTYPGRSSDLSAHLARSHQFGSTQRSHRALDAISCRGPVPMLWVASNILAAQVGSTGNKDKASTLVDR